MVGIIIAIILIGVFTWFVWNYFGSGGSGDTDSLPDRDPN